MEEKKLEQKEVDGYVNTVADIKDEVAKLIVGQKRIIEGLVRGFLCNSHVLVEGIPGIAKTSTIRALSIAAGCEFTRIQFTVDLLPTDILGLTSYDPQKGFYVIKGPIFSNFVLADEINRSPPKTQSAMLEAMQEHKVTIGKQSFELQRPFFVMATQNPVEQEGTFPLPEAQLDRFLFKLFMDYPTVEDEFVLVDRNISIHPLSQYEIKPVTTPQKIVDIQDAIQHTYMDDSVKKYIVKLVDATRHPQDYKVSTGKYVEWGSSPRGSIGLFISSKAQALMQGRTYVTPQDVKDVAYDVLNHRVLLNYEGQAEGIKTPDIIEEILKRVKAP
jgi:MoxR-like ATPase